MANAAIVTATAPMMFDWMVKKLKKLAMVKAGRSKPLINWVITAATTATAITRRNTVPMVRPVNGKPARSRST